MERETLTTYKENTMLKRVIASLGLVAVTSTFAMAAPTDAPVDPAAAIPELIGGEERASIARAASSASAGATDPAEPQLTLF